MIQSYLENIRFHKDSAEIDSMKENIIKLTKKMKDIEKRKVDSMNSCQVINPYLPTNHHGQQLDISKIFASYYKEIAFKIHPISERLDQKHFDIHTSVIHFVETFTSHTIKIR